MADDLAAQLKPLYAIGVALAGPGASEIVTRASIKTKEEGTRILTRKIGRNRTMRNFPKQTRNVKAGIGFDVAGDKALIKFRPDGMWALMEEGARPHMIGAGRRTRSGKRTRARKRGVLVFGANQYRTGPVKHPGTKGFGLYSKIAKLPVDTYLSEATDDWFAEKARTL